MSKSFVSKVLAAATAHGEQGDPDMEVGDLQLLVRDLWQSMTLRQQQEFSRHDMWRDLIANWVP